MAWELGASRSDLAGALSVSAQQVFWDENSE